MQYYRKIMDLLESYFKEKDWKRYFLNGGCYWLADYLHYGIKGSVIMINRMEEHCALYFDGGLYDVTGRIPKKNYVVAGGKELKFMTEVHHGKIVCNYGKCCCRKNGCNGRNYP